MKCCEITQEEWDSLHLERDFLIGKNMLSLLWCFPFFLHTFSAFGFDSSLDQYSCVLSLWYFCLGNVSCFAQESSCEPKMSVATWLWHGSFWRRVSFLSLSVLTMLVCSVYHQQVHYLRIAHWFALTVQGRLKFGILFFVCGNVTTYI